MEGEQGFICTSSRRPCFLAEKQVTDGSCFPEPPRGEQRLLGFWRWRCHSTSPRKLGSPGQDPWHLPTWFCLNSSGRRVGELATLQSTHRCSPAFSTTLWESSRGATIVQLHPALPGTAGNWLLNEPARALHPWIQGGVGLATREGGGGAGAQEASQRKDLASKLLGPVWATPLLPGVGPLPVYLQAGLGGQEPQVQAPVMLLPPPKPSL